MNQSSRKTEWLVWGGLALTMVVVVSAFAVSRLATAQMAMPVIGSISDFRLTNQNDEVISMGDLRGKVWVADIIFTTCGGPCPVMSQHFSELQARLPAGEPVRLVSFTRDPEVDTPPVLKKYAERFKADGSHWWFLTGAKHDIYKLAVNDFKFFLAEERAPGDTSAPAEDLNGHSTWFALVDRQGRTRGWVDSAGRPHAAFEMNDPETPARLLAAIRQLLKEPAL